LGQYELRRNGASKEGYQLNLHLGANKPLPDDMVQLRAAIDGNPKATRTFFLANQGMIPRDSFFNPANMQALVGNESARKIA
jgi:hypothetical protein